jgi:hypothetical protein
VRAGVRNEAAALLRGVATTLYIALMRCHLGERLAGFQRVYFVGRCSV